MTEPFLPDPLDELRRANPAEPDQLSSASLARVRARVQEATMTDIEPEPPRRRSLRRVGVFALGGAAAAAVVAIALLLGPGSPGVAPGPSTGPGVAQCVETYSLETLRNRGFAFDGNVTAVDGDEVTFAVNNAYRGPAGEVTLTAMGMTGTAITSAGGPNLAVGSRYLVAGDDHFVWACGFTQDYNPAVAAAWADALGG
jgi:hypothetical protein